MQFKYIAPVVALVCAVSAPVQAEDTLVSLTEEMVTSMEAMNAKLDTIKDKATAEAAAPEIKKVAGQLLDITLRMQKVAQNGQPSAEDMQKMMAIQTKNAELAQKLQGNMTRLQEAGILTPEFLASIEPDNAKEAQKAFGGDTEDDDSEEEDTEETVVIEEETEEE